MKFLFFFLFLTVLRSQQPPIIIDCVAAVVEDNIVLKSDLNQMVNMMAIQRGVNPNENFDQYTLAKKQMKGGGTIVSFELLSKKNLEKTTAFKFLNNLNLIDISNNLGDSKTLITHPYTTTHHRLSKNEKNDDFFDSNLRHVTHFSHKKTTF